MRHLASASIDRLRSLADKAFEVYDFGDSMSVEGSGGWEWTYGNSLATKSVFLKDTQTPDADSVRYRFMVEFKDGNVVGTNLSK